MDERLDAALTTVSDAAAVTTIPPHIPVSLSLFSTTTTRQKG